MAPLKSSKPAERHEQHHLGLNAAFFGLVAVQRPRTCFTTVSTNIILQQPDEASRCHRTFPLLNPPSVAYVSSI